MKRILGKPKRKLKLTRKLEVPAEVEVYLHAEPRLPDSTIKALQEVVRVVHQNVSQRQQSPKGFTKAPTLLELRPTKDETEKLRELWEWQEMSKRTRMMLP